MKTFNRVFTVIVFLFLYIPMIVLAVASFNAGTDIAVWKGFTFAQYGALFRDGSAKEIFSDYFDLIHNGIGVPQVRRAAQLLRDRGVDMPGNIILYSQFIDRLKILMWRKNK